MGNSDGYSTLGDALVTAGAAEAALAAHRVGVERYVGFLNTVRLLSTSLDDSLAVIAEPRRRVNQIRLFRADSAPSMEERKKKSVLAVVSC